MKSEKVGTRKWNARPKSGCKKIVETKQSRTLIRGASEYRALRLNATIE